MLRNLSHSHQVYELRVLEDVCDNKLNIFLARCSDYIHSSNRVPAQLEDAVFQPDTTSVDFKYPR